MRPVSSDAALGSPWAPYVPDSHAPWDPETGRVHLHRGPAPPPPGEDDPARPERRTRSVDQPAAGRDVSIREGIPAEFAAFADRLAERAQAAPEPNRLKAWWIYRMLFGPDPLTERLTLLWHNHFATSNLKVNDLGLMRRQNETSRALCRAPFGRLLHAMLRDPALLVWLDALENTKRHPNENLARELLELFTLGIGHYSEEDVKQAALAALDGLEAHQRRGAVRPRPARRSHQDDPRAQRRVRRGRAGRVASRSARHVPARGMAALPRVLRRGGDRREGNRRVGRGTPGPRPGHGMGRRDGAPFATVL